MATPDNLSSLNENIITFDDMQNHMPTSAYIKEYFQQLNTAQKLIDFNIKYYTFRMF